MPDKPTLFFDVNETLLDLTPVKDSMKTSLGFTDEQVKRWFTTLLHYSLVLSAGGRYEDFGTTGAETLRMIAGENGRDMSQEDCRDILKPMRSLPPHDDVKEGLRRLQDKGFRLYALTNGSEDALNDQIHNAGLGDFFEGLLSVDKVRKFKPHREVYEWAAKETGTAASDCVLIAAHPWDIAGAGWAGWQTVYLQRSPTPPFGLANTPDYTIEELGKLVQELE